jgi:septum formation protein
VKTAPDIVLASASPRRRDLLASLGRPFRVVAPGIDEQPWPKEAPASYALRNASDKARHVAGGLPAGRRTLIIAADTIVVLDGDILEKPHDAEHAAAILRRLSGRTHEVITGLCVLDVGGVSTRERAEAVRTDVDFRDLSPEEIAAYVASGEPLDKAGAYAIQGGAAAMVTGIRGSHTNVVGLPMERLRAILAELGILVDSDQ